MAPTARARFSIVLCFTVSCAENPSAIEETESPDEKVLTALDPYNPLYKVNADGRVTHLSLAGKQVLASAVSEVGKLTELRMLSFSGASITDDSLANLRNLSELKSLYLAGTPISRKGLIHLDNLHNLRWLWLPQKTFTKSDVDKLTTKFPGLSVYLQ